MDERLFSRSLEDAFDLLESLEKLLRGGERVPVSKVRVELLRFKACVEELGKYVEEELRNDYNELLQLVGARFENLQQYPPEDYLNESEREDILKELPYWSGILEKIKAARLSGDLPTLLELFETRVELLKREVEQKEEELEWSRVLEHLQYLSGILKKLESLCSEREYLKDIKDIVKNLEPYLEKVKTKSGKLEQSDRDRLKGLCNEWLGGSEIVRYRYLSRVSEERREEKRVQEREGGDLSVSLLCFEIAGESYCVEVSPPKRLVVGRYDPGGRDPVIEGAAPEGLKILEGGNVLYVFNSVKCRWGCIEPDGDCTHREHVEIEVRKGAVAVRMAERAVLPVYYGFTRTERKLLRRADTVLLKPGQCLYLWISGVYRDARQKREQVPLLLSFESRRGRVTVLPS